MEETRERNAGRKICHETPWRGAAFASGPVNTHLICRGVHKKFMAGNQEPVLRRIKWSTGGRSQPRARRSADSRVEGGAPSVSRGKLRARRFMYLYRPRHISRSPLAPPVGNGSTVVGLEIKFSTEEGSLYANERRVRIYNAYKFRGREGGRISVR